MKLTKFLILFFFLSIKGFSQQAVLTSSGEKLVLNYLSSSGGTITGTLGVTGNTTISGTATLTGINNTGTITNTGTLINTGNLTVNGNGTITGTLTLPSLAAETLLGTNGSSQIGTVSLTGDITTTGLVATLSNTGVISGTYGSSSAMPLITVDSKGRITTITTTPITASGGGTTHTIGESYGGGIVFYVYDNGQHGLIAATSDQSSGTKWNGGSNINTRARADGVGAGLKNTAIIIGVQASTITPTNSAFAATVCNEYNVTATTGGITTTYGDWYLPSKYELNLLYLQKVAGIVVGFADTGAYWSSMEVDGSYAWFQNFGTGFQDSGLAKSSTWRVRAIRSF